MTRATGAKADRARHQLTGVAGVHYVAAFLNFHGLHAMPTTRNVQGPDVLLSNLDGSEGLALQVKTTAWAMRTRGRGASKVPHHYEWEIGWQSAKYNTPRLFFALVDLKEFKELPDIYFVPSKVIFEYFKGGDPKTWIRARFHPKVAAIAGFKNKWELLEEALGRRPRRP